MTSKETVSVKLNPVEYVEFIGSGDGFRDFEEDLQERMNGRTIDQVASGIAEWSCTYALRTFKRMEGEVERNGHTVRISSDPFDASGTLYLSGTVLTRDEVAAREGLKYVLYNMDHHYRCGMVIKHRRSSQWEPFFPEKGDVLLSS